LGSGLQNNVINSFYCITGEKQMENDFELDNPQASKPVTSNVTNIATSRRISGFELPLGGAYFLGTIRRTLIQDFLGAQARTTVNLDGVSKCIPIEVFNNGEITSTSAGPGEIAGEPQFTCLFQYAPASFVRATGYSYLASLLRNAIREAIAGKKQYAQAVENGASQAELDKLAPRIVYFDLAGEWRPNITPGTRNQGAMQDHTLRTTMSLKIREMAAVYSDGSSKTLASLGESTSNRPGANDEYQL
jgi:hypothetical protein